VSNLEDLIRQLLVELGEDPERPGLELTPQRVEQALRFMTQGYHQDARQVIGGALFREAHHNMVLVRDVEFYSLCEHHMLPFYGRVHVAYIPDGCIVGLSKLARVVDIFARRLQVQERMTDQIVDALESELHPRGVGVVVDAVHLCMMMRGVEKQNSRTITSAMRGSFLDDNRTRDEFLRLVHGSG
jgi:GTP cyclohydrolase IA